MLDGTIVLIGNRDWGGTGINGFLTRLITNCIVGVTGSDKIHIKRYLKGYWYESCYPEGARKTTEIFVTNDLNLVREPVRPFTEIEILKMIAYGERAIAQNWKYNLPKLIALAVIIPFKKFFNWLGWIPFSDDERYGTVCSVYDDQMVKSCGVDTFPGQSEEITPPANYEFTEKYRDVR